MKQQDPSLNLSTRRPRRTELLDEKETQWHFGMKAHRGVDPESGLMHSVLGTATPANGVTQAHQLVHGEEADVFADAGPPGVAKREETQDLGLNWHVAMRPGKPGALDRNTPMGKMLDESEHTKVRTGAKGVHPFRVIKRQFGYVKVQYCDLPKNMAQLMARFALNNL